MSKTLADLLTKGSVRKLHEQPSQGEELVHYSRTAGLKQLDPNKMGTSGVGGAQYKRGVPENKSTFFYTANSKPEDMVAQGAVSKYTVRTQPHHKIYDLGTDPDHLVHEMRSRNQGVWNEDLLHGVIKEKGYHGVKWKMHDETHVVQMYHPTDIHSEEDVNPYSSSKLAASEKDGYNSEMGELLTKGFVRNAALAGMVAMGTMTPNNVSVAQAQPPKQAVQQKTDAFKHKMLRTIASVETSSGQNLNHETVDRGLNRGHKAYGKYGLMPITIKEVLTKDPQFKNHFHAAQKLEGNQVHAYMQKNPGLEDQVARSHLRRLRAKFGDDPAKIGYAWLNGVTGTNKAIKNGTPIKDHWHVKKILNAFNEKPQEAPAAPARQSLAQVKTGGSK